MFWFTFVETGVFETGVLCVFCALLNIWGLLVKKFARSPPRTLPLPELTGVEPGTATADLPLTKLPYP